MARNPQKLIDGYITVVANIPAIRKEFKKRYGSKYPRYRPMGLYRPKGRKIRKDFEEFVRSLSIDKMIGHDFSRDKGMVP